MSASPREQLGQRSGRRTLATTGVDSASTGPLSFVGRAGRLTRPKLSCPRIKKSEPRGATPYSPWSISASVPQSPTTGGIILAHEVARQLGARAVYAERREDMAGRELRGGFTLGRGERVVVVDDVMTTGGSVQETIEAVRSAGGRVVGAAVLVDRSGGAASLDVPLQALWTLDIPSYAPSECPLCAKGLPATHPGTTPAPAGAAR